MYELGGTVPGEGFTVDFGGLVIREKLAGHLGLQTLDL